MESTLCINPLIGDQMYFTSSVSPEALSNLVLVQYLHSLEISLLFGLLIMVLEFSAFIIYPAELEICKYLLKWL